MTSFSNSRMGHSPTSAPLVDDPAGMGSYAYLELLLSSVFRLKFGITTEVAINDRMTLYLNEITLCTPMTSSSGHWLLV